MTKYRQKYKTKNKHLIPNRAVIISTLTLVLFVSMFSGFDEIYADEKIADEKKSKQHEKIDKSHKADKKTSATSVTLKDLGVLQLAAHDLFLVDRTLEIDHENGKLDLSTLLDHGDENITIGGEPRNRENIMLFTVASEFGEKYLKLLDKKSPEDAKKDIIKKYHKQIKQSYKRAFGESLPEAMEGKVTFTENLALRTIHDLLPGNITVNKTVTPVLDVSLHGKTLSKSELRQPSSKLDGQFDSEFRNIRIVIPPNIDITIDLLERDSSFAQQFETDFTFEHFLGEISDGSYDKEDQVMQQIRNLFAKGLHV